MNNITYRPNYLKEENTEGFLEYDLGSINFGNYDFGETKSYGIFLVDEHLKETKLIYEIFNGEITKMNYSNYLIDDNAYLDIYMRIISKAIKRISVIEK